MVEPRRWTQAGGGERLVQRVVLPVNVEIAKRDQVGAPGVALGGPARQPAGDLLQLGDATGRALPVDHVQGDQREDTLARPAKLTA